MAAGVEGTEAPLNAHVTAFYAILVVLLVLGAGLMSGLTLGLLSLDVMDLEVLRVSGTQRQQSAASRLIPLVAKPHWLLCTLLLCNAACMEALPLFLDRLLNPVGAILLSVTAILMFGEIIPQAVCSRYGVAIGSTLAPLVRVLMVLCAPITWPLGKLLDWILGHEDVTMKRQQLKAMVQLHGEGAGLGGKLNQQEVSIISGAIDLRYKTAISAMTPLPKVFMVSDQALLDEGLVRAMLHSGHSRVPVYRGNDVSDFAGLILVKEVLQFWRCPETPRVSQLCLRPLPRLPADTPMFDMLRFFQTGNSHMALLTAPEGSDLEEFKRTKGFMMTRDDDDSTSSSSSSHSSSDSCASSEEEGGTVRSIAGSVSSSFKWRLRRRKGKGSSMDRRNSLEGSSKPASLAGSDVLSQSCIHTCSCPCHAHVQCGCDTSVSEPLGAVPAYSSASLSPQQTAARLALHAPFPLLLPAGGTGASSVTSSIAAATGACSSSIPSPSSSNSPSNMPPAATAVGSHISSISTQPAFGAQTSSGASQLDSGMGLVTGSPHGSPRAADAAAASRAGSMPAILHGVQHEPGRSPFEAASLGGLHESYICCRCLCQLPQPAQQQPLGSGLLSRITPVSHPVVLQHHHHHHHHHQQQQEQSGSWAAADQQGGSGHVALTVSCGEVGQQQQQQLTDTQPRQLPSSNGSSHSSGSSPQHGPADAPPAPAGMSAAALSTAATSGAVDSDVTSQSGSAAPLGSDEQQDQLGPLIRHSPMHQQWGHSSNAAAVAALPRQVPVGIITLEDVIEELMQAEIVDETDAYMDNDKTKRVDLHQLMESLPPSMLATLRAEMLQAAQNFIKHAAWTPGTALNPNNVRQMSAIRAVAAATAGGLAPPPATGLAGVSTAAGGISAGGVLPAGTRPGSPNTSHQLSPGSGGLGLNLGVVLGASPASAAAAVVAPRAATAGTAAVMGTEAATAGPRHWSSTVTEGGVVDSAAAGAAGEAAAARGSAAGRSSDGTGSVTAGAAKLRVASSPAGVAPGAAAAAAAAVPIPIPGGPGAAAGSTRVSAPGVLSRSPASVTKPLTKAFKSTPPPMLGPLTSGTAAAGAAAAAGLSQQLQEQQSQKPE